MLPITEAATILRWWGGAPNDATAVPWWGITVENKIGHRGEIFLAGPYFSREDAQAYLDANHYNFPRAARVYCFSGHESRNLRLLYDVAKKLAKGEA